LTNTDHGAISAVAVAIASTDYISKIKWGGSTPEDEADLAKQAGRESTERHLRAVADARAAVARATPRSRSSTVPTPLLCTSVATNSWRVSESIFADGSAVGG